MSAVEFRSRSQRVPRALFPSGEVRIYLGHAANRRERAQLGHRREVLKKIARRGQWDVLARIRDRQVTVEEVVRIVDESGIDTLHIEIQDPGAAGTLGKLVPEFLATVEVPNTRANYEIALDKLMDSVGADRPWDQVGRHDINELLDRMRDEGFSPGTRAVTRIGCSAFYTWVLGREEGLAEREGRPPRSLVHPVRKSRPVRVTPTRNRFLLPEELDRLLEAAPRPMRAQYLTLAYTGMRIGEFMSRRPEEVGPDAIRIHPRADWAPKGWPRYDHGVRVIPIETARLRPALDEYRERWAGERTFFVNPRTLEPWQPEAFRDHLRRDIEAAGLVYGRDDADGITPHTFRHTLASWLAQRDVQLLKIAQILGDTLSTVARYYAHLLPADLARTIDDALGSGESDEQLTGEPT